MPETKSELLIHPAGGIRMAGEADIGLVRHFGTLLPESARLLEIGPFLGGISKELIRFGKLSVVDRFIWSETNARDYPRIAEPGESFRSAFEQIMSPSDVTIVEGDYRQVAWPNGPFHLVFIDAPRHAHDLLTCLLRLASCVTRDNLVLLKNGASPSHPEMTALVGTLLERGVLSLESTDQPPWCTIAVLRPGDAFQTLEMHGTADEILADLTLRRLARDPWGGPMFQLARIAERAQRNAQNDALSLLGRLEPSAASSALWDRFDAHLRSGDADPALLFLLSELVPLQTDAAATEPDASARSEGPVNAIRAFWRSAKATPTRIEQLNAALIIEADGAGARLLPAALPESPRGQRVIEIGADLGLSGVGFLTAGAASHLSIETGKLGGETRKSTLLIPTLEAVEFDMVREDVLPEADLVVVHCDVLERSAGLVAKLSGSPRVVKVDRQRQGSETTWRVLP